MAETVQALTDELRGGYGFDVTESQALIILNRRHREMVARGRVLMREYTIGTTTAGQAAYTVPADVVEIDNLYVAGRPYSRVNFEDSLNYNNANLTWTPADAGLYVASGATGAAGGWQVKLIPTPSSAVSLTVFGPVLPAALTQGGSVQIDEQFTNALVAGAAASLYGREAEQLSMKQILQQEFDEACAELLRRNQMLMKGRGPVQIRTTRGR